MTGLPDPAPRRSRVAAWLSAAVAAIALTCAVAAWSAASLTQAGARAKLLDRNDDLLEYHLLRLEELVQFRFLDLATAYLAVAILFAALAVAVRIGPRWSVVLTGSLSAAGALITARVGLGRLFDGLPQVGEWGQDELAPLLTEAAPEWFGTAVQLPLLATFAGLPLILVLLFNGYLRARAHRGSNGPELGW